MKIITSCESTNVLCFQCTSCAVISAGGNPLVCCVLRSNKTIYYHPAALQVPGATDDICDRLPSAPNHEPEQEFYLKLHRKRSKSPVTAAAVSRRAGRDDRTASRDDAVPVGCDDTSIQIHLKNGHTDHSVSGADSDQVVRLRVNADNNAVHSSLATTTYRKRRPELKGGRNGRLFAGEGRSHTCICVNPSEELAGSSSTIRIAVEAGGGGGVGGGAGGGTRGRTAGGGAGGGGTADRREDGGDEAKYLHSRCKYELLQKQQQPVRKGTLRYAGPNFFSMDTFSCWEFFSAIFFLKSDEL